MSKQLQTDESSCVVAADFCHLTRDPQSCQCTQSYMKPPKLSPPPALHAQVLRQPAGDWNSNGANQPWKVSTSHATSVY